MSVPVNKWEESSRVSDLRNKQNIFVDNMTT